MLFFVDVGHEVLWPICRRLDEEIVSLHLLDFVSVENADPVSIRCGLKPVMIQNVVYGQALVKVSDQYALDQGVGFIAHRLFLEEIAFDDSVFDFTRAGSSEWQLAIQKSVQNYAE